MSLLDEAEVLNAVDEKRERFGLAALNGPEQVLTLLSYARFKIKLSGVAEFFVSPLTADFTQETGWAFEQLGAWELAAKFRRISKAYSEAKRKGVPHLSSDDEEVEAQFLDELNTLDQHLSSYISAHKDDLPIY